MYSFTIENGEELQRIDKFLTVKLNSFTRSKIQKLCDNHHVLVNGNPVSKNYQLSMRDRVEVIIPKENRGILEPENSPLDILFEDQHLAIINKPKGMIVHPTTYDSSGTLAHALLFHYGNNLSTIAGEFRPGIVHRIDKDTSGLLIVALDDPTHERLNEMMLNHEIERHYQGVIYGHMNDSSGEITSPIGRDPHHRTRMAVVKDGRPAITHYQSLENYPHFSKLAFQLQTGRTHQIRVHLASVGHPLAGDAVYGPKKVITMLRGQCLHSYKIAFTHPITGEWLSLESPLPPYFEKFIHSIDR